MTAKKVFFILIAGTVLAVGAFIGTVSMGKNLIVKEGNRLKGLKLEDAVLDRQATTLTQAKRDIEEYSDLETIAKSVVPQDKDQAKTVLELVTIAGETGIELSGITFPASELGQVTTGKKSAATDSKLTQLTPLSSPKGVYSMEITLTTDPESPVRYDQLIGFLERLEKNRRTSQVSEIQITPDPDNRNLLSFNLTVISYIKP